jgi:hypothetical protein
MTDETIVETPVETPPSWFIDENVPGVGERPQWLDSKFKTAADLAKSYRELEKKVGTPPDEYDLSKSKFLDGDYEPIQEFLKLAKDKRVPKDVVDKMVESIDKYMDEFSIDYVEETKKLGDNASDRLTVLDNWAQANLSKDSYEALTSNLKTASAIKALEELRGKMMSNTPVVPNGNDSETHNVATIADIQKELANNLAKYKTDPKYQADIRARLEIASKNSNYVDKSGY